MDDKRSRRKEASAEGSSKCGCGRSRRKTVKRIRGKDRQKDKRKERKGERKGDRKVDREGNRDGKGRKNKRKREKRVEEERKETESSILRKIKIRRNKKKGLSEREKYQRALKILLSVNAKTNEMNIKVFLQCKRLRDRMKMK